ncbi:PE-PPE domain-containing protein [Nocardia sp. BMG111209]|uniref:PE-PPE domain-containing protein n=1 Tax=Nocardia sp. BMG111209 TaxID=1160137 RepID=UPI00036FB33C|nr:PE-PPE domain-containing protein [Nocardia sp. BMG111209]
MLTILTCRGTGEPLGGPANLLTAVTRQLDPVRFRVTDIDYPAGIGPVDPQHNLAGCSEEQSVARGVVALTAAIRRTTGPVAVLGYSLGAEVVTRFLEAKGRGEFWDCEPAWAATVANPLRQQDDSIDPDPVGFGINGQHDLWPDHFPIWEAAHPADGITSCPADSPLRTLADVASAFSFAELGGWTADLADRIRRARWQPANSNWWHDPVGTWNRWSRAAALVDGYLTGAHTTAYVTGGHCDRLAALIDAHD